MKLEIDYVLQAMIRLTKNWKNRNITKKTKITLVNTVVIPISFYASETWVILSNDRRIDGSEICGVGAECLRVPWTARTNASILNEIQPAQRLASLMTYGRILKLIFRQHGKPRKGKGNRAVL